MKKLHAAAGRSWPSGLTPTLCGRLETRIAETPDEVTCKQCLARMATAEPLDNEWRDLVPGTRYDPRYDRIRDADIPGRLERRFRWPGIEAALRALVVTRTDGYASKSVTAGLTQYARLGAQVQSTTRRPPRALEQAEDAAQVDASLWWACSQRDSPPARTQRVIVLARLVGRLRPTKKRTSRGHAVDQYAPVDAELLAQGLAIDVYQIPVIVREAKRYLRIDLGARGLVPPPHGSREVVAMEMRAKELAARRSA